MKSIKNILKNLGLINFATIPFKIYNALGYYNPKIILIFKLALKSKEISTFTYKLSDKNIEYLIHNISIITNLPYEQIKNYYKEIDSNTEIHNYIINKIKNSKYKHIKDARSDFGSRIAYYCIIRAMKPKIVVENGVEIGYTGVVLCSALLKNKTEGYFGSYYGFDLDPNDGLLINEFPYSEVSQLIIGESLNTLTNFENQIDFYFSDGGRELEYEKKEFELLENKINKLGIVISNKLQFSNSLSQLANRMNKKHIYFREEPLDHWYPGSHIGIMF